MASSAAACPAISIIVADLSPNLLSNSTNTGDDLLWSTVRTKYVIGSNPCEKLSKTLHIGLDLLPQAPECFNLDRLAGVLIKLESALLSLFASLPSLEHFYLLQAPFASRPKVCPCSRA
jgi:hypothetical protein